MSRAVNLSLGQSDVRLLCEKRGIAISAMESLPTGGTRLVCVLPEGTEAVRHYARASVLDDSVARFRYFDPHRRTGR